MLVRRAYRRDRKSSRFCPEYHVWILKWPFYHWSKWQSCNGYPTTSYIIWFTLRNMPIWMTFCINQTTHADCRDTDENANNTIRINSTYKKKFVTTDVSAPQSWLVRAKSRDSCVIMIDWYQPLLLDNTMSRDHLSRQTSVSSCPASPILNETCIL